jgi:hypothetical protein
MDTREVDVSVQWAEGSGLWTMDRSSALSHLLSEMVKSHNVAETSITLLYHDEPIYELSVPLETFLRSGAKTVYLDALISSDVVLNQPKTLDFNACIRASGVLAASNLLLTSDAVPELLRCFQSNSHRIYAIELGSNFLGDVGVEQLLPSIFKQRIFSLDLSSNHLTDTSLAKLIQLLKQNRILVSLNLRGNQFTAPSVAAGLKSLLEANTVISFIDIESSLLLNTLRLKFGRMGRLERARMRRQDLLALITGADDAGAVGDLLASGIDTWTLNDDGETLLHYAVEQKAPKIVQRLLKDPGILARLEWRNNDGLTPLQLACTLGYQDIVQPLILDAGALLDSLDASMIQKMKEGFIKLLGELCERHDEAAGALAKQLSRIPSIASSLSSPQWGPLLSACATSPPEPPKELKLSLQSLVANECLSALDRCDSLASEGNRNAQVLYGICAMMVETPSDRSSAYLQQTDDAHPMLWATAALLQPRTGPSPVESFSAAICILLCDLSAYPRAWRDLAEQFLAVALKPPSQAPSSNIAAPNSRVLTIEERFEEIKRKYPSQAGPLTDLMKMTGLRSVKEKMLALFDELEVLRLQSSKRRKNMNARFEGNPGTFLALLSSKSSLLLLLIREFF